MNQLTHTWTDEERTAFIKNELEKEILIKKIVETSYQESKGCKVSAEQFLKSKLVNPTYNKFI